MQTLKNTYNAIETMHGKIFYTEAPMEKIGYGLNNAKFIEVGSSMVATNQIIEVRPANGPEYFEKFVLPNLSRSIAPKIKTWISECKEAKKIPTIEQIQAKIDYLQSEEDKFNLALKEFTPEQREERLRQIQETKERIFNK